MGKSKAAKVWHRTWVGGLMVAITWGLLWVASQDSSGGVLLGGGWILACLGVAEVSRMGSFSKLSLGSKLGPALALALVFSILTIVNQGRTEPISIGLSIVAGNLIAEAGVILLVVLVMSRFKSVPGSGAPVWLAPGIALWTVLPLTWLHHIQFDWGIRGLIALIILSKIGDTAGYFTGNAIGKSHPFPNISPGKTTAGCVASLIAGTAVGGVCVAMGLLPEPKLGLAGGFLCGALINVAAQAGDLLESRAKRVSGVKDSGTWFGPAGGVLDMTDSLLLTVPVALATWPLLFEPLGS